MVIWAKLKEYVTLAASFGVGYWVLTRLGGFSQPQAIILAIIVAVLLNLLTTVVRYSNRDKFEPFTVTFAPQWFAIVTENRLLSETEFLQMRHTEPKGGFRFISGEFKVARLSPTLWFFSHYSAFRSTLDIDHTLDELVRPEDKEKPLMFAPRFYFKEASDKHPKHGLIRCIEFGLITDGSMKKSVHWSDDRGNMPLGKLPDAVFNPYYADENFALNEKISEKDMKTLLEHYGWVRDERDYDSPWELDIFKHKYMTVYLESI